MEKIELKHFTLKKEGKEILSDIDFLFNTNISLIGTSCSGKTMLLKELEKQFKVARVEKETTFFHTSIEDELKYLVLDESGKKLVKDFFPQLLLSQNPNDLKTTDKIKLSILKKILNNNGYIAFDMILDFLKKEEKTQIITYLKRKEIKYIIVSNNLENLYETEFTYILNEGKIIAYGKSSKILLEEKLLKRLGFTLPFMLDLSLQLKAYGLINSIYLDKEMLVNRLWK